MKDLVFIRLEIDIGRHFVQSGADDLWGGNSFNLQYTVRYRAVSKAVQNSGILRHIQT